MRPHAARGRVPRRRDGTSRALRTLSRESLDVGLTRPTDALLSDAEVVGGHLDAQHSLALVADDVERLRLTDRPCHGLSVTAALARDDGPHHVSRMSDLPRGVLRA